MILYFIDCQSFISKWAIWNGSFILWLSLAIVAINFLQYQWQLIMKLLFVIMLLILRRLLNIFAETETARLWSLFTALDTCTVLSATACRKNLPCCPWKTSQTYLNLPDVAFNAFSRCKVIAACTHARPRRVAFGNSPALPG